MKEYKCKGCTPPCFLQAGDAAKKPTFCPYYSKRVDWTEQNDESETQSLTITELAGHANHYITTLLAFGEQLDPLLNMIIIGLRMERRQKIAKESNHDEK